MLRRAQGGRTAAALTVAEADQDGHRPLDALTTVAWDPVDAVHHYRHAPGTPPHLAGLTDRYAAALPTHAN